MLAVGVVSADVGLGYQYRVPQTSYGVPSYQHGGNSDRFSSGYTGNTGYQASTGYQTSGLQGTGYQTTGLQGTGYETTGLQGASYQTSGLQGAGYQTTGLQGTGYQTGLQGTSYLTGNVNSASGLDSRYYQSSGSNDASSLLKPNYQYTANSGLGTGFQSQYEASSQYQTSALKKYQQHYQVQQQPAQVFKHFYVHAAPEEPEPVKPRAPIVLPPAQKHYKIIFVKAPSEGTAPRVIAPVQPQNEEKTIVYVLVKKPEDQQEIVLPKIEQKPPSKPEVYFIKYKNKEDSQAVINNIVKDYNHGESLALTNAGASEASFESGLGNVQYQSPVVNEASTGSFGSQSYGLSSASADLNESNIANSISSPVTVSSTASSIGYEGANAISTSQGVPHETYGPPKFRVN